MGLDLTTVLIAVGPASITGALGYYGAKKSSETAIEQARVALNQIGLSAAINDRREREKAYLDLLDRLHEFALWESAVGIDIPSTQRWRSDFEHAVNAVVLLGYKNVPSAVDRCATAVRATFDENVYGAPAFKRHQQEFDEAHSALIAAMREDVEPKKD